jgi:toxin ParE1/3/4
MSLRVLKHRAAIRDLLEHFDYISLDNEAAAWRFYAAAEASFLDLGQNPTIGAACQIQGPRAKGLRSWHVKGFENYLIFYRPFNDRIEIARVLHGARDLKRLFKLNRNFQSRQHHWSNSNRTRLPPIISISTASPASGTNCPRQSRSNYRPHWQSRFATGTRARNLPSRFA